MTSAFGVFSTNISAFLCGSNYVYSKIGKFERNRIFSSGVIKSTMWEILFSREQLLYLSLLLITP